MRSGQLVRKLVFLVLFCLFLPSYSFAKSFGDYEGAVYIRNYDGDTITFNLPRLHQMKFRISKIDANN